VKKTLLTLAATVALMTGAAGKDLTQITVYGVAMSKCKAIVRDFSGPTGSAKKAMIAAYVAGFGTAVNISSTETDNVFGGYPTEMIVDEVMAYCRKNPSHSRLDAITSTLAKTVKGDE
jgi:hypothetical protein